MTHSSGLEPWRKMIRAYLVALLWIFACLGQSAECASQQSQLSHECPVAINHVGILNKIVQLATMILCRYAGFRLLVIISSLWSCKLFRTFDGF